MKYSIFRRSIAHSGNGTTISFTSLQSPGDLKSPIQIDADNATAAANKASELLKMLGLKTHSIDGNPDTIMTETPRYFVGSLALDRADRYDTLSMAFHIDTFTPVPQ